MLIRFKRFLAALFKRNSPELVEAAEHGDLQTVHRLLAAGASPNSTDQDVSALTEAVKSGCTEVVEALLNAGANPHARIRQMNELTQPILYEAVRGQHWRMVEMLIAAGAEGNADTILQAALAPDIETIQLLLKSGANPDSQSTWPEYEDDLIRLGLDPDEAAAKARRDREWMTGGSEEPYLARQYLGCPDEIVQLLQDLIHGRKNRAQVIDALEALKPRFPRIEDPQPDKDLAPGPAPFWHEVNANPDVIVALPFDPGERPPSEIADAARLLAEDGVTAVLLRPTNSERPDEVRQLITAIKKQVRRIGVLVALQGSHTELIDLLETCAPDWLRAGLSGLCLTVTDSGLDSEEQAWTPVLADLSRGLQAFDKTFRIIIDGPNDCMGLRAASRATACDVRMANYGLTPAIDAAVRGDLAPLKKTLDRSLLGDGRALFAGTTRALPAATPCHILIGVLGGTAVIEIGDWLAGPHNDFTAPHPWTVDDVDRASNGLLLCRLLDLADRATAPRIVLNTVDNEKSVFLDFSDPLAASSGLAIAWIGRYGIKPVISTIRFDAGHNSNPIALRCPPDLPASLPRELCDPSLYPGRQFGMHSGGFRPGDERVFLNEVTCDAVTYRAETFHHMIRDLITTNYDSWHRLLYRMYVWGHLADSWPRQEKWTDEFKMALRIYQKDSNPETRRRLSWIWAQPELLGPVKTRNAYESLAGLDPSRRSVLNVFLDLRDGDAILLDYFGHPHLTLDQWMELEQLESEAHQAESSAVRERARALVDRIRSAGKSAPV